MPTHSASASLEQQRQQLLQKRARIDAELAILTPSSAPTTSGPYHERHQHRSHSHSGQSMSRTISSGRGQLESLPMSVSVSQRSGLSTASNRPSGYSMSGSSIPFTMSSRVPRLQTADSQQEASVMDTWTTSHDNPVTAFTCQPRQISYSLSQRQPDLEQVVIGSGDDPKDYFARQNTTPLYSATLSPIDIPTGNQWRTPSHRGSTSSRRRPSFNIPTPTTPSSAVLTNGTTLASEMSRGSSLCNDNFLTSLEMMNVHSNTSIFTDNSTEERLYQSGTPYSSSSFAKLLSYEERSLLVAGTGGASEDSQYSYPYQDHGDSAIQFSPPSTFVGDMKRQHSNESNSSSTSATRAAAILKRQNQLSTRPLAPKAGADGFAMSQEGGHPMVTLKSKDGLENRAVAQNTKQTYRRPKHDRVFCNQCNDHPDGFRGAHELGRHQDRQHKEQVKKFVCVEPVDGIIDIEYRPVYPLSKCKACSQQKKKYGAYYNAAAHLRRAHFKPKTRSRGKCTKLEGKSEMRGGKGGGSWPPMAELKRWMKEVQEHVAEGQQEDAEEEEDEEEVEDDECSGSFETDDGYAKLQGIPTANSRFDDAYLYTNDTNMIDAYSAPASNFATQDMQSMQYDNIALTQSIDLLSQSSFADSHFAMNDPISFIDPFPQNFDEHVLGQDSFHTFQY